MMISISLGLRAARANPRRYAPALDAFAGQLYAAVGMRRMLTSYNGPLIRARRQSDGAVLDFGYAADGWLDSSALLAWAGASTVYVATVYDQTGSNRHAAQATTTAQPRIVNNGVLDVGPNGRPVLVFDGGDDFLEFQSTTAFSQNRSALTMATTYRRAGANGGATDQQIIYAPTPTVTRANMVHLLSQANGLVAGGRRIDNNSFVAIAMPTAAYTLGNWTRAIARFRFSSALLDAIVNGSTASGAFQTAGVTSDTAQASGVRIGATHVAQQFLRGEVAAVVLAQSALDATMLNTALYALSP